MAKIGAAIICNFMKNGFMCKKVYLVTFVLEINKLYYDFDA